MIFAPFAYKQQVSVSAYDPDAQAFFTAAGITDTTQKSAVNTLVVDLKSNSLWNKMFILYPFVGGTSTTSKYNLKNTATYTITWNGGVTFDANGVTGNGSTGYGQTGWIPKDVNALTGITTSLSVSVYSRSNRNADDTDMGTTAGGQPAIQILPKRASGNCIIDNYNSSNGRVQGAVTNSLGLFISSRTAQNSMKGFRNSTSFATNTTNATTTDISTTLTKEMYVLAQNNNGTAASYSQRNIAFAHIGLGLSDAEVSTFYTLVQNYQTTLGRQV